MTQRKPIVVEGKSYPSISAAARQYGISSAVVSRRLKSGWKTDRAFKEPRMSMSEAAKQGKKKNNWMKTPFWRAK